MQIDRMIAFCQFLDRCIPLVSLLASASSPNIWEKGKFGDTPNPGREASPPAPLLPRRPLNFAQEYIPPSNEYIRVKG